MIQFKDLQEPQRIDMIQVTPIHRISKAFLGYHEQHSLSLENIIFGDRFCK